MHNNLNFKGATQNNGNAGVSAGTAASITTTAATNASVRGYMATPIAAGANQAVPIVDAGTTAAFKPVPPGHATTIVIGTTRAGQLALAQGSIEKTQPGSGNTAGAIDVAPQFPNMPDDFCPLAYAVVRTAPNSAAWVAGTSAWGATGVSASFTNVATLPERPQAS